MAGFHEYPKSMNRKRDGHHVIVRDADAEAALGDEYVSGHDYWAAKAKEAQGEAVLSEHNAPEVTSKPKKAGK